MSDRSSFQIVFKLFYPLFFGCLVLLRPPQNTTLTTPPQNTIPKHHPKTPPMNLNLRKFDMSSIDDDKVVVLIGKRDTGKSFLCKDLLYYHQDIPVATVISTTLKYTSN